jgi:hypothetical protein
MHAPAHRKSILYCVPPKEVPKFWPFVAQMIDDSHAAVDLPTPDVRTWLIEEKGLLWIAVLGLKIVGCLTTSLERQRSGLVCRMVSAGADALQYCTDHQEEIEAYARAEGCSKMVFEGRPGWGKMLRGYAPKTVSFEKALL